MRKTSFALVSTLAFTASIGSAWAQTPAPATPPASTPPASTPPAASPPAASPAPAAAPAAAAEPAPAADESAPAPAPEAAPAAPPAEEESFPAAWMRFDSDGLGFQAWAGATHMLSDTVGIATDIYLNATPALGEFDLGPSFVAGPVYITPMLGIQMDWVSHRFAALVPQLYITGGPDPIYMELWVQNYQYSVFDKAGVTTTGGSNYLYTRFFIDYKMGKYFGVGPEVELTYSFNDKLLSNDGKKLYSLPVGLNLMLSNYGKNNVMYLFGGYETVKQANEKQLAGRLTFVHNF